MCNNYETKKLCRNNFFLKNEKSNLLYMIYEYTKEGFMFVKKDLCFLFIFCLGVLWQCLCFYVNVIKYFSL